MLASKPPVTPLMMTLMASCECSDSLWLAKTRKSEMRNPIGLDNACRIVDEAVDLGFSELFLTGGEPFILDEIYDMLAYASMRLKTTVLTNAMLFNDRRMARLCDIASPNLQVQVSFDGRRAEHHDAYRGPGTWNKRPCKVSECCKRTALASA